MSVRADIEAGWKLPATSAPFAGRQLDPLLRHTDFIETIAGAIVTRIGPVWTVGRNADAWLVSSDRQIACPLIWSEQGELVVTVVLTRAQVEAEEKATRQRPIRLSEIPTDGPFPVDGRPVVFTDHAVARFEERVGRSSRLDSMIAGGYITRARPSWYRGKTTADAWLFLSASIAAPLWQHLRDVDRALVATTVVTREEGGS